MTTKNNYECDTGVNFNSYYSDLSKAKALGIELDTTVCDYCEFKENCE